MLVFILMERCYRSDAAEALGAYLTLSDANYAMDCYNDSSSADFYATVEEFTLNR